MFISYYRFESLKVRNKYPYNNELAYCTAMCLS